MLIQQRLEDERRIEEQKLEDEKKRKLHWVVFRYPATNNTDGYTKYISYETENQALYQVETYKHTPIQALLCLNYPYNR